MIRDVFQQEAGECRRPHPAMCRMDGLKSPLVFSADCVCKKVKFYGKHCDEIAFCAAGAATGVYCIENKGGSPDNLDARYIRRQLQGGAQIVGERLGEEEKIHFLPVLVTRHGVSHSFHIRLLKESVRIRNIKARIFALTAHSSLPQIIKNMPK